MRHNILVTQEQIGDLEALSESEKPNEAVALLVGRDEEVLQITPMHNTDHSQNSFSVDPLELMEVYSQSEQKGLGVIGIFHSHPGSPEPSATDLRYMEINPVIWMIYSNTQKEFKAHIIDDGLRSVEIRIA